MNPMRAPYGTWSSPITAEAITKGSILISDVLVDSITSTVYHLESRPSEAGRSVLVQTESGRDVVGKDWNVRSSVHEYGGAAAIVHGGTAYFSNMADGRVYKANSDGGTEPESVTPKDKPYRYASFDVHPTKTDLLAAILEDHTEDAPATIVNTICVINTTNKTVHTVLCGEDFYATPKFSPDGSHLAWMQWSHPDMPWEGAEVHVGDVSISEDGTVSVKNDRLIAGVKEKISTSYPSWANSHTLFFTSDESGYINPWKFDLKSKKVTPLFSKPIDQDFGRPMWVLNYFPYAVLDKEGNTVIWSALKDGRDIFYLLDLASEGKEPQPIDMPYVEVQVLRIVSQELQDLAFIGQRADEKAQVVQCSLSSLTKGEFKVLKSAASSEPKFPAGVISPPQPMTLVVDGVPLHVVYHPPTNPEYEGSSVDGERPPCVVNVHGGPTAFTSQALDWRLQYFTSRGWGWLDVNYGGSSGYGRRYIERLAGHWGVADVDDCILAARSISSVPHNLIDPNRLVIRGGSAGGFTVLAAISIVKDSDLKVFAAATSSYGISDLQKLGEFTHKFESRYLEKLAGGTFEAIPEVYKARSPVWHAERIGVPLLLLQGEMDKVVPKEQSDTIYEMIKSRGGTVEYELYPGEGHGWRREENMCDALERELGFYERVLGLKN